jgi:predicted Ser/Thr protein kinase
VSLAPGTTLGQYTIVSAIGAGGMGEVYRATDTRLGRDVAIKVLPDDVAANPDRLARFEREARALAALNHFNIAQVYGFEGTALIMELLEGETLRERIERGPLPIRKAIEYATQIARGLAAAHDRGIIHRDLKPENVFVVTDGHVKILDFGLARHEAQLEGVTRTAHHSTTPGTVLGTVGYMSPEQVRGAAVDARSDLFSLGAVLYEMLTGTRAFRRESSAETMAAIVNDHPREVTVLRADVTPSLDRIVQHCLEKSPLERFQSARDVAFALDSLSGSAPAIPGDAPASSGAPWERIIWAALAASLAVALVWALMPAAQPEPPPQAPVTRTLLPLPNEVLINEIAGQGSRIALSPDGSRLVFHGRFVASGQSVLFVLPLDGSPGTPLAGTEAGAAPFWSPDGRQIMFTTLNTLVRLPLDGGNPVPVATGVASGFTPGTWNQDGVVLIGGQALHQVTVATGAVSELLKHDNEIYGFPQFLPDGRRFIDSVRTATGVVEVHTGRLGSADTRVLLSTPDQGKALYAAGALLYTRGTTLFGQRVEGDPLTLAGEAVSIAAQLESTPTRGATFTVSDNGVLVYQTAARQAARLTWMDRTGTPQSMIGDEADYNNVELSANNLRALVSITDLRFQSRDIFLVDLERGVRQRFTNDPSDERSAIWSQDNRRVLYSSISICARPIPPGRNNAPSSTASPRIRTTGRAMASGSCTGAPAGRPATTSILHRPAAPTPVERWSPRRSAMCRARFRPTAASSSISPTNQDSPRCTSRT